MTRAASARRSSSRPPSPAGVLRPRAITVRAKTPFPPPAPPVYERLAPAVGDERALRADRPGGAHRQEEHVPAAQQLLRAGAVDDRPAVHLAGHGEGDARGDVRLD